MQVRELLNEKARNKHTRASAGALLGIEVEMKKSIGMSPIASAALLIAVSAIAACAGAGTGPSAPLPGREGISNSKFGADHRITHVFVIMQENRTVDNLFNGLPGANTATYGMAGNTKVTLVPRPIATTNYPHNLKAFLRDTSCPSQYGGSCAMNGFAYPKKKAPGAYAYVDPQYTKPYFAMAEQYAFGDNMFPSNIDASFVAHQYLVAAQANGSVDFPSEKYACSPGESPTVATVTKGRRYGSVESACFTYTSIVDELQTASLPWRYYIAPSGFGLPWWSPFNWIPHDQSAPGGAIISGPSKFLTDIKNSKLPYNAAVTWITPTSKNSDHAGVTANTGPEWVAAVVNAIGTSKLWDSSVIFISWDDWGGWYDHVSPPYKDYDGLGIRVPFVIISPYTKKGLVTHTQYEQSSILKYIENRFGLPTLGASDARATDPQPDVMSNGNGTPRPFATISAGPYSLPDDPGNPDNE